RRALTELQDQDDNDWFIARLHSLVIALGLDLDQTTSNEENDMDLQIEMEAIQRKYEEWERKVRAESRKEGREEGRGEGARQELIAGIKSICATCGIELSPEHHDQMAHWDLDQLRRAQTKLFTTRQWTNPPSSDNNGKPA
ncbi:MAG: hypothetical protein AAGC55_25730, partial [Myxococcota bacterium]